MQQPNLTVFKAKVDGLDEADLEEEEANLRKVFSTLNSEHRDRLETIHLVLAQLEYVRNKINTNKDIVI